MTKIDILYNKNIISKELSEHYTALATNIQFLGKDIKKIVVSSVQENEGKSTVSINLAKSLADLGLKVLIIDGDTRNSVMLARFKARGKVEGLTSYLSGSVGIENVLYETDVNNLTILPSGQIPPNPTSLLQSRNFEIMLSAFEKYYDYIIIDAPPVGAVIDAAIIAKQCDGSILVVQSDAIKRKFVKKAKDQLEQSGSKFLGVILNKVDMEVSSYGGYGIYGNYGNYGKK
ncbi:polysaccharide biosynthesis tyrosine autokinase [Gemella sp. GH3]|uniref:polysaccharide biosynthesis tyrosine autokinase n=1 Tax=unclassified Gemella TaxID=2624949 RepID=UPI0015D02FCF|nr:MULTISPECIES: polysaccharide biosynthesis tyrosine autokinase [unclassified Gemella]MBF0713332.1 polysaccharide biosynthesis tyrosine autokinase [Gemella sp. GH3.1]NYS50284.1 polysaccharide biosynthesis tyrosine autokinase [Gemella sp. GH3]